MAYIVTDLVRQQARKLFSPGEADLVISELETTRIPLVDDGTAPERIHLAILYLSNGDLREFDQTLNRGKMDFRDTLVSAGLAHEDWRVVLRSRGIDWK